MATNPAPSGLTLPLIMQYLQSESSRYERDRNYWELERAEMKARIAKLEGERQSTERMKEWYLRRLRMMEVALQEERLKNDPEALPLKSVVEEAHKEKRSKADKRLQLDYDKSYVQIISNSQASLRDQAGRTKARGYLEKCLTEITYLVKSHPSIGANRPLEPPADLLSSKELQAAVDTTNIHIPGPRPMKDRAVSPPAVPIRRQTSPALPSIQPDTDQIAPVNGFSDAYIDNKESTPLDEIALEEHDQVERITHTFNADGQFVDSTSEQPQETQAQLDLDVPTQNDADISGARDIVERHSGDSSNDVIRDIVECPSSESGTDVSDHPQLSYSDTPTLSVFEGHTEAVYSISGINSEQSSWYISAGADSTININRDSEVQPVMTLKDHTGSIASLVCSHIDGKLLIYSGGDDMVIRKWEIHLDATEQDSDPYRPIQTFVSHSEPILGLTFVQSDLVSISTDRSIRRWNIDSGDFSGVWWIPDNLTDVGPTSVCSCAGDTFAVGHTNGQVALYHLNRPRSRAIIPNAKEVPAPEASRVNALAFVTDQSGSYLVAAHEDSFIRIYDYQAREYLMSFKAYKTAVTAICAMDDGKFASASHDGTIKIWSCSGECIRVLPASAKSPLTAISYLQGKSSLIAGDSYGSFTVYGLK